MYWTQIWYKIWYKTPIYLVGKERQYEICGGKTKSNHHFTIGSDVHINLNSKSLNSSGSQNHVGYFSSFKAKGSQ